jgi:hypothetical protein
MGEVLSNVIGAPFSQYIIEQLKLRAANGSSANRSNEQILYLANKMSWTRLCSSVRIKPENGQPLTKFYANLFNGQTPPGDYSKAESLAQNWILQAGTSEYNNGTYSLRSGLGPNNAYGLGGIDQQGYRPMPGLTSVTIDTKGTLGSLREATVNFQVWNMTQLDVIEALYFRLGYTMLLEWGHVNYFNNKEQYITNSYGLDIFKYDSKERIFQAITQKNKETNGNYDAMLGTVTNFFFSFNSQGGYDCSLKLIGLGSIIDTLRINQTYILPESLATRIEAAQALLDTDIAEQQRIKDEKSRIGSGLPQALVNEATSVEGINAIIQADTGKSSSDLSSLAYPRVQFVAGTAVNTSVDYFYKAQGTLTASGSAELNLKRTGLFLTNGNPQDKRATFNYITYTNPQPVTLFANNIGYFATSDRKGFINNESDYRDQTFQMQTLTAAAGFDFNPNNFASNTGELLTDKSQEYPTTNEAVRIFDSAIVNAGNVGNALNTIVTEKVIATIPYVSQVTLPGTTTVREQQYFIRFIFDPKQQSIGSKYTRQDLIHALDNWFLTNKSIEIEKINTFSVLWKTVTSNYIGISGKLMGLVALNTTTSPVIKIQFNDTGIIDKKLAAPPPKGEPTPQPGNTVDPQGDTEGQDNETDPTQTEQVQQFSSALHTMLNAVKTIGYAAALNKTDPIIPIDLTDVTRIFYNSGVLQNIIGGYSNLNQIQQSVIKQGDFASPLLAGVDFELTKYAIKGFNSNLMADKTNFSKIADINWTKFGQSDHICTAYFVGYEFKENETMATVAAEKPVYIKLGYLLAFLNNMCLLYESTSKNNSDKGNNLDTVKPYFYIDFHPEYNFCLTSPLHMTIDPYKCYIPFVGLDSEYATLFPDSGSILGENIFKPESQSTVSNVLRAFKTAKAYQGKTMEILLNTQFLLELANRFITNDKNSALNLKPFLDTLMDEIGKSTGNLNLFRVAYRDDSNTIIIKDDQWTPNLDGETSAIVQQNYKDNRQYMELQVFGSGSLVRDMEFRTNMNTKMSSMIAISAQSGNQVANGVNAGPIQTYNVNYEDAIMKFKQDASENSNASKKITKKQEEEQQRAEQDRKHNTEEATEKFNHYVIQIYRNGTVPILQTSFAAKYYQDHLAKRVGADPVISNGQFIPANLSITLDGISGIVIGNAFGIPENRLPSSLRGADGFTKVGFTVVGLTHTLENNQWLTKIRGQMIRLRQQVGGAITKIDSDTNKFNYTTVTGTIGKCNQLGCVRRNGNSYTKAALYQDATFRAGVDTLTKKYQLKDSTALYKILYAESRLDPNAVLKSTNATGLLQFLPKSAVAIGTTVDIIKRTDGVGQLKFVEKYFDQYPAIKGGDIYSVYAAVFFPILLKHLDDPNWIIQSTDLSAYTISYQNTPIACSAGKQPGESLTVSDFKKYVDCIS